MNRPIIVAIDGTAGSGKSTTARGAAQKLGFAYLNTGTMYRILTYKIIQEKIDYKDINALQKFLDQTSLDFTESINSRQVIIDGKDITSLIRSKEVDDLVSLISAIPQVREKMVKEQRRIAQNKNIIVEGRDIGSVVFPDADLKFYLDCSLEQRALRRQKESFAQGTPIAKQEVEKNLKARDHLDSTRKVSPLQKLPDAIYIDTTNLTIEEEIQLVVDKIKDYLERNQDTK
ncbi:MAG: (d)CMP kinase [candidate division WOR-3 bacterium]|nr:(d)CMP kinase [candidate division WOR-3 bacterium]